MVLEETGLKAKILKEIRRVIIIACGTSYHAALVGKFMIEELARIPTEVDLGSEFRYRDPIVGPQDLLVAISQSGETTDTLAAFREGKQKGVHTLAICNVVDSSLARESERAFLYPCRAGDRRGLDQGFYLPARRPFLAGLKLGAYPGNPRPERGQRSSGKFDQNSPPAPRGSGSQPAIGPSPNDT